ncbi:MAG: hypothetical protein QM536_07865 [Chitinophagaceae bacterium]|nr:hypothetical protein [Chitinophagaceae bacterium]
MGIATKLKDYIRGTQKTADTIRTIFKNNFTDFAKKFNQYVESVNMFLRKHEIAQKLLFIVDGLEKVNTHEIRKRIILEESNRFAQIKVNTIFTLPIELQMESRRLLTFSKVISFPFVKILEKNGNIVEKAVEKFTEFVYKRIDARLFDNPETVKTAILHCGGSPRELLRILEYTYLYANRNEGILKSSDLHNALKRLAAESSHYISEVDLSRLKKLKTANEQGEPVAFNEEWQNLIENSIIFEYNDGTFKRVNPIVEISELYKHYVR